MNQFNKLSDFIFTKVALPCEGKWVTRTALEGEDLCDSMEFNYSASGQRNDAKIFMFIVELMPE